MTSLNFKKILIGPSLGRELPQLELIKLLVNFIRNVVFVTVMSIYSVFNFTSFHYTRNNYNMYLVQKQKVRFHY
jgi:hypothetical protein